MLTSLELENFTVFRKERLTFGKNLNVFIGENGSGKTHLLKAAYAGIAVLSESRSGWGGRGWGEGGWGEGGWGGGGWGKSRLQIALAEKFVGVFRPDALGRLVRRAPGRLKCGLRYRFGVSALDMDFGFTKVATQEVSVTRMPTGFEQQRPVFLPTRELLTIAPGFVALYDTTHLPFEETWRDTCLLLGAPLARGARDARFSRMLGPLEKAMGGSVEADKSGRFYLNVDAGGKLEMHLVAEGLRKLAMIARLVATGSLRSKGYLFWDEPEANLNPKVIKAVAQAILEIAEGGIQVFVATHSLFLMRELHILQRTNTEAADVQFFGLRPGGDGIVEVRQGPTVDDIGNITALDEDLMQADRYMDVEMGIGPGKPGETA